MTTLPRFRILTDSVVWADNWVAPIRAYQGFQLTIVFLGVVNCLVVWLVAHRLPQGEPVPFLIYLNVFLLTSGLQLRFLHAVRVLVLEQKNCDGNANSRPTRR